MAINYGRKFFERVLIFRPHNVYGPDMGFEHVVPQFARRLKPAVGAAPVRHAAVRDPGQRQGRRAASATSTIWSQGVIVMRASGEHLGIYHVGTTEEISIADLARRIAEHVGREIDFEDRPRLPAAPTRRCPDISKAREARL